MRTKVCGWLMIGLCLVGAPKPALTLTTTDQSQATESPLAKVTVVGREAGVIVSEEGGKKQRYILVDLDAKTRVKVASKQDVGALHNALMEEHRKLTTDFLDRSQMLIAQQDYDRLAKEEEAFRSASRELLQHLGYCVVEGTLSQVGGELRMDGQLRLFQFNGADKALAKGMAVVRGEAVRTKGMDDKSTLAVRNGSKVISVSGLASNQGIQEGGTIRVFGVLRSGGKDGGPIIEAEKVEGK